jgi:hypothetical protein
MEESTRFFILQSLLFNDIIEQFTTRHKLHDQEQLPRRFNYLVQLHDVGMSDYFEYLNFTHDSCYVSLLFDLVLLKYFYCYFFLGQHVCA